DSRSVGRAAVRVVGFLADWVGVAGGPWGGAAGYHSRPRRSEHALEVDPAVLVEALVLDRDRSLLHIGRDVARANQDPVVVVEQSPDLVALVIPDDGVPGGGELLLVLQLRQVLGGRHHHPEEERDDSEQAEADHEDQQAQLLDAAWLGFARTARADSAGEPRRRRRLACAVGRPRLWNMRGDALAERLDTVAAVGDALAADPAKALDPVLEGVADRRAASGDAALLRLPLQQGLEVDLPIPILAVKALALDVEVEDRAGAARGAATGFLGESAPLARDPWAGRTLIAVPHGGGAARRGIVVAEAEPVVICGRGGRGAGQRTVAV